MSWTLIMPGGVETRRETESVLGVGQNPTRWAETLFEPDDILEIRVLPPKQLRNEQRPYQFISSFFNRCYGVTRWFRAGELENVLADLHKLNHIDGVATPWGRFDKKKRKWQNVDWIRDIQMNIHCSANPRTDFGGSRTTEVALARSLFADFDYINPATTVATIEDAGVPSPTMIVDSGHGTHTYWRLNDAITDMALWTNVQKRLIQAVGSDPGVHDPARMTRIPGFQNVNWTPKLCAIVSFDLSNCYELSEIQASLPPLAAGKPVKPRPQSQINKRNEIAKVTNSKEQSSSLERALAYQAEFEPAKEGARNSKLFDLCANIADKFDLAVEDVVTVADTYNQRLESPLVDDEVRQVAENAHRHVEKNAKDSGLPPERRETLPETGPREVPLDTWRVQMREARITSLTQPGTINFDGSATGAGKSTADFAAMKVVKSSITFVPTHKACAELAQDLNSRGLEAAAFPAINESTCQRYGTRRNPDEAQLVQRAGLDVGVTLCPSCNHYKKCAYQQQRELARNASHAVATHARASHSVFAPAEDRDVIFIHEDARTLLRPMVIVTSRPSNRQPSIRDLKDVFEVARQARNIAKQMNDELKRQFAVDIALTAKKLINELEDQEMVEAAELSESSLPNQKPSRAKSFLLPDRNPIPDGLDVLLHRAMFRSVGKINGEALKLVIGAASGQLERLCAVVDDVYIKNGRVPKREFYKSLVGVWSVDLPEAKTTWIEDATGDIRLLRDLVKRPVCDRTPVGILPYQTSPIQVPIDVTMNSSPNTVRGLIRGALIEWRKSRFVGIITHQCHLNAIEKLEPMWRKRIKRVDYYHSGNDRASNSWLDCDLLIILGTPRVPPAAVRHTLIQIGSIEAAGVEGNWANNQWEGKTISGKTQRIMNPNYSEDNWRKVHEMLVRNVLLQAVGRGRGVTETGIPVVVLSTEELALPFADQQINVLKDSESRTLQAVHDIVDQQLSTENAKYNILGETAVSTSDISANTRISKTQTLAHCHTLSNLRLLKRKGERGGWILNSFTHAQL